MSVVAILIIIAVAWAFMILCTLLVLAALMRSSQISQRQESAEAPLSKPYQTSSNIKHLPAANY